MTKKRKRYKKGLPADYKGASPEEVAEKLLRYRPTKPAASTVKPPKSDTERQP